jgi:hypothetical protein
MEDGEYLNFVFEGDKAIITQAKNFSNIEGGNSPY